MTWEDFQKNLYKYYCKNTSNPLPKNEFEEEIKKYKERKDKYIVYFGYDKKDVNHNKVLYIGTTIQIPISRWFYHSTHGKDLYFEEKYRFDNAEDMLRTELEMIQKYHPSLNKITSRKQNLNAKLSKEQLDSRIGNPCWCQKCLRRHVRVGYKYCLYCN